MTRTDQITPKPTGRRRKDTTDQRRQLVAFRVTDEEKALLEATAAQAGIALSDLCRHAARSGRVAGRGPRSGAAPVGLGPRPRLGNNLNQLIRETRFGNFRPEREAEAQAVLNDLSALLRRAIHDR